MFGRHKRRDQALYRSTLATLPQKLEAVLAMIRNETPAAEIDQAILAIGVALFQTPSELALIRIADCQTGDTKRVSTILNASAPDALNGTLVGITGRAMLSGKPQLVNDVLHDNDYRAISPSVRAELALPLRLHDSCSGVINFETPEADWFTEEDLFWGAILAQLVALANQIDVQRVRQDAEMLTGIDAEGMALKRDLTKILDDILTLLNADLKLLNADARATSTRLMVEVLGVATETNQLITLMLRPDKSVAMHIRIREGEGIIGNVFKTGRPFIGPVNVGSVDNTRIQNTRSSFVYPLIDSDGQRLGVLNIESRDAGTFSEQTLQILQKNHILDQIVALLGPLVQKFSTNENIIENLLDDIEAQIFSIIDPEDLQGAYFQMLQSAAQITEEHDVAGAILRIREEALPVSGQPNGNWVVVISTLGDYKPELAEWPLEKPSIFQQVYATKTHRLLDNVASNPLYRSVGERFANGSELMIPLIDDDGDVFGALDLVSPRPNAFTTADARYLQHLAKYIVQAISRADVIETSLRAQLQLQSALQLYELLMPLYSTEPIDLPGIRQQVVDQILEWVTKYTDSDLGMVLIRKDQSLVLSGSKGPLLPSVPERWSINEGITGLVVTTGATQVFENTDEIPQYVPAFQGVHSELATPIKQNNKIVGVLDVEADDVHHYTNVHRQWVEFFATLTANAIAAFDLAERIQREITMGDISDVIDELIFKLREIDLDPLYETRDKALKYLLEHICALTGARRGEFLLTVNAYHQDNAYHADNSFDDKHGRFVEEVYWPLEDPQKHIRDYFSITQGLHGVAFHGMRSVFYNSSSQRTDAYVPARGATFEAQSCVIEPIFEGPYVIGVLSLESDQPDIFLDETLKLVSDAALTASDIIVSAKLRMEEIQSDLLRDFDIQMLQTDQPDMEQYVSKALKLASKLTDVDDGWGQLLLVRRYQAPDIDPTEYRIEKVYDMTFTNEVAGDLLVGEATGVFSTDHVPVLYPIFLEAITSQESQLILDVPRELSAQPHLPWPLARSILCIPLTRPGANKQQEVYGLLTVVSPQPCYFDDSDDEILRYFVQAVAIGMRNQELLRARDDMSENMTHDLVKTIAPLRDLTKKMKDTLNAPHLSDAVKLQQMTEMAPVLDDLVGLTRDLIYWFVDLSDEDVAIQKEDAEEDSEPILVQIIVEDIRDRINTFAKNMTGHQVQWDLPSQPLSVVGSETRTRLIKAALFKYIENALKYGPKDDVWVTITQEGNQVVFCVRNVGMQINVADQPMLFELGYRGPNARNTSGQGMGLYQVRRIAELLGGKVDYKTEGSNFNNFYLRLPLVSNVTRRRE